MFVEGLLGTRECFGESRSIRRCVYNLMLTRIILKPPGKFVTANYRLWDVLQTAWIKNALFVSLVWEEGVLQES